MMHWASNLIGLPWAPEFTCWDLVRRVFKERHNIDMPHLDISSADNVRAITEAAHVSGWRPAEWPPMDADILVMNGLRGRHVGTVIDVDGKLLVLHCRGHMTPRGPVGCVVAQPLSEVTMDGYHTYETWRRLT